MVCLFVAALIWPLFRLKYLDQWGSIESTFIADAQMLNSSPGLWQPAWYAGTRWVYVYPPLLRHGTALIARTIHSTTARAYHLYIALHYVIGILAVYILARVGSGKRRAGWIAAAGVALLSPILLFFPDVRADNAFWAPQRLHVLMTYGEGPHISSLCLLPFVFAAWLRQRIVWAAVAAAAVVSNNFYGATALAILFPLAAWAMFVHKRDALVLAKAAGVCMLAYGLTTWWLVPSYLRVTQQNLRLVAEPGNLSSVVALAAAIALFGNLTWRYCGQMSPYRLFVLGGFVFLFLYCVGHRWFGFQVAGNSMRLLPELDLFFILVFTEVVILVPRAVAIPLALAAFATSYSYLRHPWMEFPRDNEWEKRPEYTVSNWMWENQRNSRAFVTGSLRFWYNTWHTMPQLDGGSQQGILNQRILAPIAYGGAVADKDRVLPWLDAMGVDVAIIPEKDSREYYHDIQHAEAWRTWGLTLLHDDGKGNLIYRIPRPNPGIVHLVPASELDHVPVSRLEDREAPLQYLQVIHAGRLPLIYQRLSNDEARIEAEFRPGESIVFQESFDPYWRAYVKGKAISVRRDPLGFVRVDVPSGKQSVTLRFETPAEMIAGRTLSALSLVCVMFSLFRWRNPIRNSARK